MRSGQGLAVHFIAEQGLGVHGAGRVDADIVLVVGGAEANVGKGAFLFKAVVPDEVAEFYATPPGDLAPAFDAFEFEDDLGLRQLPEFVDADMEDAVAGGGDL